ncbi:hypothetical protein BH09BAC5_BH09BAC5_21850 [soil metagenome]
MNLPKLVRISILQTEFNPSAIDAEVYLVNDTELTFRIAVNSESFTTIDENSGETVEHGSLPAAFISLPGNVHLVANVEGWEWDGHVGVKLYFRENVSEEKSEKVYDLKSSSGDYFIEKMGISGRIINGK